MYGSKRTQGPLGRGKENTAANTAALKKVPPSVGRRGAGGKRSRGEMLAALAMAPKTADNNHVQAEIYQCRGAIDE